MLEAWSDENCARLHLEFDSRIGTGKVSGHEDHWLQSATPFALRGCRYYHGAQVVNASGSAEYRIHGINGGVSIDATAHPGLTVEHLKAELPADSWFDIYDYGAGDEVVLRQSAPISKVRQ